MNRRYGRRLAAVTVGFAVVVGGALPAMAQQPLIGGFLTDPTPVSAVTLVGGDQTVTVGAKRFLEADVTPPGAAAEAQLAWTSSAAGVVQVNAKGMITAMATGTATIAVTATAGTSSATDSVVVTVNPSTALPDLDTIAWRWAESLVGTPALNWADQDYADYAALVASTGQNFWDTMDTSPGRTRLWPVVATDIPTTGTTAGRLTADMTRQFTNLRSMTYAFTMAGSRLYENPALLRDIVDALEFERARSFFDGHTLTPNYNWWDYQIGSSKITSDILILLRDYLDQSFLDMWADIIDGYETNVTSTYT
jgi:hypothetical protein